MKAVGIIAEYNPLHNGHKYHLEEARRLAGSDAVVVVMSGNYVQRGEPAILNKWDRTRLALENGADLVIELPTMFSIGNAKQFADAGVEILNAIPSIKHIAFGSESGDIESLKKLSELLKDNDSEINVLISKYSKEGNSFPKARAMAFEKLYSGSNLSELLNNKNDSLALQYLMANTKFEPIAIKRLDDISASAVRENVASGKDFENLVPSITTDTLKNSICTSSNDFFDNLKFAILNADANTIDDCPSGGEGLGNKIICEIKHANTWDELVLSVKSKRYTYTRISRLLVQIMLGITRKKFNFDKPEYIRVLGFNDKGRKVPSEIDGDDNVLPVISNISKQEKLLSEKARTMLELDIHASDIYNLVTDRNISEQSDYRISPIIL